MIDTLKPIIRSLPFFAGLTESLVDLVVGCAENVRFEGGHALLTEGQPADDFYLLREGRVLLSIHGVQHGKLDVQTLGGGEMVGWSWLVPPYRARFDATTLEPTRALRFDGKCLRGKCEQDPGLGYELLKRVSETLADRLESTRLQLIDVYGPSHGY